MTPNEKTIDKYTAQELYGAIRGYKSNTWKDSPEYAELIRRLSEWPLKKLKEDGYFLPNWRVSMK